MKAKTFDARFDRGDDVTSALDLDRARRPLKEEQAGKEGAAKGAREVRPPEAS